MNHNRVANRMDLATAFRYGKGVKADIHRAIAIYKELAEDNHPDAQFALGYIFEEGELGIPVSRENAFHWYLAAAENGDTLAQVHVGELLEEENSGSDTGQQEEALGWYRAAADNGNALAQLRVGSILESRADNEQDLQEAIQFYKQAAEQEEPLAYYHLGMIHLRSNSPVFDAKEARFWLTKAANEGDNDARYELGELFFYGRGVAKSYARAAEWYQPAARQNHIPSTARMALLLEHGLGCEVDQNRAKRYFYRLLSSDQSRNAFSAYLQNLSIHSDELHKWNLLITKYNESLLRGTQRTRQGNVQLFLYMIAVLTTMFFCAYVFLL